MYLRIDRFYFNIREMDSWNLLINGLVQSISYVVKFYISLWYFYSVYCRENLLKPDQLVQVDMLVGALTEILWKVCSVDMMIVVMFEMSDVVSVEGRNKEF